ncbi:hypothetical protein [Priestia flexa]|uniref:hypothetical protein n=1 Tax=Priestia flexa TaxID=86664 RepID=UPI000473411A|nr:hypothetical protein [Priestia flexa]
MVNSVKPKHDEKTWIEQTVEPLGGHSEIMEVTFKNTKPNYVLITNTCSSPLYVSTSPNVSSTKADIIIPPWGMQLFVQMHGLDILYLKCYDENQHSVTLKSWEGEFDPAAISQSQKISPINETTSLGTVTVDNFPKSFAVTNLPTVQRVQVENPTSFPSSVGVNNFPTSFNVGNFPTQFGINNFPANQAVTVSNPYKPLEVKESFTGTGNLSKTFGAAVKSLWFKNDGTTDITITINSMPFIVKGGETFDERFPAFTTMDIVATESYRARVRG